MSSWISHLTERPRHLTVLGMNQAELDANLMADTTVVHDLNADPTIPIRSERFDAVVCTVSVDYLTRPIEVFDEVARVLRPGGWFCCTFSNRCFPTKAIRGWVAIDESSRPAVVAEYFQRSTGFGEPTVDVVVAPGQLCDPLWAIWADTTA